ncbi:MAG: septum site-determining protein MinC [Defluviitaleaceae bacterium]|nr:septum site-determining protein MinC [Defluviitaleaceae bacterium]
MQKDNTVIFKGGKNGIVIIMDEAAMYEKIAESLRAKIRSAHKFFAGATTTISFKGKELTESELLALVEIINAETDLSISFIEDLTGTFEVAAAKAPRKSGKAAVDPYFHKGGLRSGQAINHNGSVVVLGDVNAGAEVVATGSVVVFGAIRGMVHAGAGGDRTTFVCATSMQPIQLRIADIITYFPREVIMENKNKIDPVYAFVKGEEIYVAPVAN